MNLFAADNLPEVIHGRSRLAILSYLTATGPADFVHLREKIAISDGNLSQHLKKLEDAGYIVLHRSMIASRSRTIAEVTPFGFDAFYDYLDRLRALIAAVPERSDRSEK